MKEKTTDTNKHAVAGTLPASPPVPMRVSIKYKLGGEEKKHYADCHSETGIGEVKSILQSHNANAEYLSHKLFRPRVTSPGAPVEDTPLLPAVAEAEAWLAEIKKLAPLLDMIPRLSKRGLDQVVQAVHLANQPKPNVAGQ